MITATVTQNIIEAKNNIQEVKATVLNYFDVTTKENIGVAQSLITAHETAPDPHPQYATEDWVDANIPLSLKQAKTTVTVGLNDVTADYNTADYPSINATIQNAYNAIINNKGGEIHILGGKNEYIDYSLDSNNLNFNNPYYVKFKGIGKVQLKSKDGTGVAVLIRQEGSLASPAQKMVFENLKFSNVERNALGTVADQETYAIVSNFADEIELIDIETEMFEKAIRIRACQKVRAYNCQDWSGDTQSRGAKNHFNLNNIENFNCQMCRGSINDTAIRMAGCRNVFISDFDYSIGSFEVSNFENGGVSNKIWYTNGYLRKNNGNAIGVLVNSDADNNTLTIDGVKVGVHDLNVHNVHIELDDIANKQPHALYASGEGLSPVNFPDVHIGYINIRDCIIVAPLNPTTNVKTFGFTFSNATFKRKILKVTSKNNKFSHLTEYGENYYNVIDLESDNNNIDNANQNGTGSKAERSGLAIWGDIENITTRAKVTNNTINMNNNINSSCLYLDENNIATGGLEMINNHLFKYDSTNGLQINYERNINKNYIQSLEPSLVFNQDLLADQPLSATSTLFEQLTNFTYTITKTGLYQILCNVNISGVNHKEARLIITKNGVNEVNAIMQANSNDATYTTDSSAGKQQLIISRYVNLIQGDVIRAFVKQDVSTSDAGITAKTTSFMQIIAF